MISTGRVMKLNKVVAANNTIPTNDSNSPTAVVYEYLRSEIPVR